MFIDILFTSGLQGFQKHPTVKHSSLACTKSCNSCLRKHQLATKTQDGKLKKQMKDDQDVLRVKFVSKSFWFETENLWKSLKIY